MADPIYIPPIVSETVQRALADRDERQGIQGMTRTAALTATELAIAPITTPEIVRRVANWHQSHPDHTTPDGRSTLIGGVWGGRAGRDWAFAMAAALGDWSSRGDAGPSAPSAMVAFYVDPEVAQQLAEEGGEPAEAMHVTLVYLGKMDELTPEQIATIKGIVADQAKQSQPIEAEVSGMGRFTPNDDGDVPEVALVSGASLVDFRNRLANALDASGSLPPSITAALSSRERYLPHITTRYIRKGEHHPAHHLPHSIPLHFGAVSTNFGDEREDEPLSAEEPGGIGEAVSAAVSDPLEVIRTIPGGNKRRKLKRISTKINTIDRDLRAKLRAGAEVAMADGLRRAGVKVTQRAAKRSKAAQAAVECADGCYTSAVLAAVGITEQEALAHAFDAYGDQADGWITDAQGRKRQVLLDELDLDPDAIDALYGDRTEQAKERSLSFLLTGLTSLAMSRLAEPHPQAEPRGETVTSSVPGSLIFGAVAIADGRPMQGPGSEGPGALGEGEIVPEVFGPGITYDIVAGDISDVIEELTWAWGGSAHPFEPHAELDGSTTTAADMETDWANSEDWPPFPNYFPGDHEGCSCSWESNLVIPEGGGE